MTLGKTYNYKTDLLHVEGLDLEVTLYYNAGVNYTPEQVLLGYFPILGTLPVYNEEPEELEGLWRFTFSNGGQSQAIVADVHKEPTENRYEGFIRIYMIDLDDLGHMVTLKKPWN